MGIPAILTGENCIVTVPLYALSPFPQSDFFSLGATIVYLLTGRNPVQIHQYRPHTAQYYVDAVPGISLALGEVLRCLLHPSPSDRYPHIQALKEGLKSAQRYD